MLHIKLIRMDHRASCKHIFVRTHILDPWGGVKRSKRFGVFFTESSHVAYQTKENGA